MRRALSVVAAVVLLLALGALAVMALPPNAVPISAPVSAAPRLQAAGTSVLNVVGMPLDSANQMSTLGGFNSEGLANLVGDSVSQVLQWNAARQDFDSWDPVYNDGIYNGDPVSTPWDLAVGGSYWLLVDRDSPLVVSFVGDVPSASSVTFTFVADVSGCKLNQLSVPLEQSGITNADQLADSIAAKSASGNIQQVSQVLQWNAGRQDFDSWDPYYNDGIYNGDPVNTPWQVKIGYPYMVCLNSELNDVAWP